MNIPVVASVLAIILSSATMPAGAQEKANAPAGKSSKTSPAKKPGVTGAASENEHRNYSTTSAVIRRYIPLFQGAHKRLLQKDPKAKGTILVEFTVKPDGTVQKPKLVASDFAKHPDFEKEILEKMQKVKFIPIESGDVTIVFPLAFEGD